jgi:chromosome segregation ATPase
MDPHIDGELNVSLSTNTSVTGAWGEEVSSLEKTVQDQQAQIYDLQSELQAAQDGLDRALVDLTETQAALSSEQDALAQKDLILVEMTSKVASLCQKLQQQSEADSKTKLLGAQEQKDKAALNDEVTKLNELVDFYKGNCAEVSAKAKDLATDNGTLKESLMISDQRVKDLETIVALLSSDVGGLQDQVDAMAGST